MDLTIEDIPETLRERDQWICWRIEERDGEETKVPIKPFLGGSPYASSTDPETWRSAGQAIEFHENGTERTDGIGFVFYEEGLVAGVDLDDARDPETEEMEDWAHDVISTLDSYTEVSPSGTGYHIYVLGFHPGTRKKVVLPDEYQTLDRFDDTEIEMYDSARFFTFTGESCGVSEDVEQRNAALSDVYETYMADDEDEEEDSEPIEAPDLDLDDEQVIDKAKAAENGDTFERLHRGSDAGYSGDTSRADLAYCGMLAFWTGGDERQMDRLFRASGRMRDKWDEDRGAQTYGELTLGKALENRTEFYDPDKGKQSPTLDVVEQAKTQADGGADVADTPRDAEELNLPEESLEADIQDLLLTYDNSDDVTSKTVVHRAAVAMGKHEDYIHPDEAAESWRNVLWRYDSEAGIYRPDGERHAQQTAQRLMGDFLSNQQANEIVGKLKRLNGVGRRELQTYPWRLVVGNGVLDLRTGELDDHTPDYYERTRVPVNYYEDAECPGIDEFFHSIVEAKDVPTLYQLVAHCLYGEYEVQKSAMLVGDGENGKSVLLDMLNKFIGERNVSGQSLQKLSEYQFAAAELQGKLANFHPDMSDEAVEDLGMFKKLTGDDPVDADVKFERPIRFYNKATMIFAANTMPVLDDDTHALWRRWIYINFPNTFDDDNPDTKPRRELMAQITAEEEFEGLLSRAVDELIRWHNGGELFTNIMPPEQVREKMKRASEPIYDFASACLEEDKEAWVAKEQVREAYRAYAREENLPAKYDNVFGEEILNKTDHPIEEGRPRGDNGRQIRAYTGVRLSSRGRQVLGLDEPEDDAQDGLDSEDGGPRGRVDALKESMRELGADEEPVSRGMILGRTTTRMSLPSAEHAFETAREQGTIYEPDAGSGEWLLK